MVVNDSAEEGEKYKHHIIRTSQLRDFLSEFRRFLGVTRLGDDQLCLGRPGLLLDIGPCEDKFGRAVEEEHDDVALVEAAGDLLRGEW